ncbi:MAG TPA: TonB-dependent receptor [Rhodanobacteraceae bacterium]
MSYRKNALPASIVAALMFSGAALAATPATPASTGSTAAYQSPQTTAADSQQQTPQSSQSKNKKSSPVNLQAVQVTGLVKSQEHSIQLKRYAPNISDSITAINIGQLPDISIADSLQRITGVQIDREAGEGTSINIRGLPEVQTLINGESFLTPDNIYGIQPNYESLPSALFGGVDVFKSPTASMLTTGISGTVNLRTRRPWDLPFGYTFSGTVEGGRGQEAGKTKPDVNALFGYNDEGKWGFMIGASYSNLIHSYGGQGWQAGQNGIIAGENSSSATAPGLGYLTGWSGSPVPSQIKPLGGGAVDVNGDGKSNGAFYSPPRFKPYNQIVQPKRTGVNASFQAALGDAFTLTADAFYTHQIQYMESVGIYSLPVSQTSPTSLPLQSSETNAILTNQYNNVGQQTGNWNQNFYTVQKYNIEIGDLEPETSGTDTDSISQNYNVDLKFDNGGPFTGDFRFVHAQATQTMNTMSVDLADSDGAGWPNTLKPGVSLPPTIYVHPADMGGNYAFNPNGYPQYAFGMIADMTGKNPTVTLPADVYQKLSQESTYAFKSTYGNGSHARAGMNVVRADGHYHFNDDFNVDFGLRSSIRSASLDSYVFTAYQYGGDGATDPQGCQARWTTSDIVLNGGGVAGACTASNQYGYFRGNLLMGPLSQLPSFVSDNMIKLVNPGQTTGLTGWAIDPRAMRDAWKYYDTEEGGRAAKDFDPADSWDVLLKERTAYGQANFQGSIAGHDFRGNLGVRIINTNLGVTQHLTGAVRPYGLEPYDGGKVHTNRHYLDILPAVNVAINLTPKLVLRLAESKNMMPLSLNQWGGGVSTGYQITTLPNGKTVEAITSASSSGNPNLKPWRSTNYGASLEWYMSRDSIFSLAWFQIRVASFIENSGVISCNIPDQDGVVRRCVNVSEPVQGVGQTLHGAEANYQQSLTFLPGFLSRTGFDINATYSPSNSGQKDMAGNDIPFQDNSKEQGNVVLWYEGPKLQVRVGGNYRSKRAVQSNYAGINGFELYQKPTFYLTASVTYKVNKHFQVFAQGQNLTNERQEFYAVWPNEKMYSNLSERYYFVGARMNF